MCTSWFYNCLDSTEQQSNGITVFLQKVISTHSIDHFKVHSNGIGVICKSENEFYPNEFIQVYFGEIYHSWRWFEKQDISKRGGNENILSKDLPDFYQTDPKGFGLIYIDAINRTEIVFVHVFPIQAIQIVWKQRWWRTTRIPHSNVRN